MTVKKMCRYSVVVFLFLLGCGPVSDEDYNYMVAKRGQDGEAVSVTLSIIRRYEKEGWCKAEAKSYAKQPGFTAECLGADPKLAPMFEAKATGEWYAIRRMGRFPPSIIKYDFKPPLPDAVMLSQLRALIPHSLKFAALHKAPAEVIIVAPDGTKHA